MPPSKLTKTFVDSVSNPGFYWDKELKGFGLRISGMTKSYIVQSRINGRDTRRTIGRHGVLTAEAARKKAREVLVQMGDGIDPKENARIQREQGITLQELLGAYLLRRQLAPRTIADYRGYMERYFADWRTKAITTISMDMIESRHSELGNRHGEAQADVAMRCVRALFNYAEGVYTRKNGDPLVTSNPTKRLSAKKQWFKAVRRETYIPEDRLGAWYSAVLALRNELPDSSIETTCDYLMFLLFTGLRSEIAP